MIVSEQIESSVTLAVQALEIKREAAIQAERIARQAIFLHTDENPVLENIAGFSAWPLTQPRYNLLRLANSPFIPPFNTPTRDELVAFLWIVHPQFTRGESPVRKQFMARCHKLFYPPRKPFFETARALKKWTARCADALVAETVTVVAARRYMDEAMSDRPEMPVSSGIEPAEYYSDSACNVAILAREFGWRRDDILKLPLKEIFQYLNEIREVAAAKAGEPALLFSASDRITDEQLALLNKRN